MARMGVKATPGLFGRPPLGAWRGAILLIAAVAAGSCAYGTAAVAPSPPAPSLPPAAVGQPQYRALWVDAFHDGIKTPRQVDQLVEAAERAHLNTLIVQVRPSGNAYFNKSIEPRASDPALAPAPYDPLGYVIQKAHSAQPRLQVWAWLNTYVVSRSSQVYQQHADDWGNRTYDGTTGGYLDPGNPAVETYTRSVFVDLVKNYDVDGIHFDFVRYPDGGDWGYSPAAVARFDAETDRTDTPEPDDGQWQQWRRERVTDLVRGVYQEATAIRPSLVVSAALIAYGKGPANESEWEATPTYNSVLQDWHSWLAQGILDLGVPMNYDSDWNPRQAGWFDGWTRWEKDNQGNRKLLIGVAAFLNYPENTLAQLQRALEATPAGNRPAGIAIYSYASTSPYATNDYYDNPSLAAGLPRQPYFDGRDRRALVARAQLYDGWFWTQLSQPAYYWEPALGTTIRTQPLFTDLAPIPDLGWKAP
jgi:uncharacterized lipoprotein YddW (UPF0748 family)